MYSFMLLPCVCVCEGIPNCSTSTWWSHPALGGATRPAHTHCLCHCCHHWQKGVRLWGTLPWCWVQSTCACVWHWQERVEHAPWSCSAVQMPSRYHQQPASTDRRPGANAIPEGQNHRPRKYVDRSRLAAGHATDAHQEVPTQCCCTWHHGSSGRREGWGQPDATEQRWRAEHHHTAVVHTSQFATSPANVCNDVNC